MNFSDFYVMTGKFADAAEFETKLKKVLERGNCTIQLRQKCETDEYLELVSIAEPLCKQHNAVLLLGTDAEIFKQSSSADGLHLNSKTLNNYSTRPVAEDKLLSVSCHTLEDMQHADSLGADILLLSPVKETSSHPGEPGLGWDKFKEMSSPFKQPVYALGGMKADDLDDAKAAGAQGVAAIAALWDL